ncbi:MAG: hypothetical protein U9Q78_06215, partial [Chloroflexota bacterium]|nr:hypothetical protein [Chloroflexota bacterium]
MTKAQDTRSVAIGGDVISSIVVTGDGNIVYQSGDRRLSFYALDEPFRRQMAERAPADFYGGTRPNWANIALEHDAPRILYEGMHDFVEDSDLPAQRMELLLGLAGEGKTTLLMRLAWNLAEDGYTVLWRHSGVAFTSPVTGQEFTLPRKRPLVLCFDQADLEEHLPILAQELAERGVRFVALGTARFHEWQAAEMEGQLRALHFQKFRLPRLKRREVEALLDKLATADALDRLAELSREEQIRHFMDRLEADRQLLPALLTARRRAESFEQIVLDELQRVHRWNDGPFLVRAYALLSAVHRFGFWLSRPLFAQALGIEEREVGPHILGRLPGLLEMTEVEDRRIGGQRLYTRHPVIAEKVFDLAASSERRWVESGYLYQDLFKGLKKRLSVFPHTSSRKLLTLLPLALKRRGDYNEARIVFRLASQADPTSAPTWQSWALMEEELGNHDEARRLFEQGSQADPTDIYTWQAWALMEKELGNHDEARRLFEQGT